MSHADFLELGSWNTVCYRCGKKFKSSQMRKNWQGFYTCETCFEIRHPQDFVKGVPDFPAPPWVQSPPTDQFTTMCTPDTLSAIPGLASPGCVVPGNLSTAYDPNADYN